MVLGLILSASDTVAVLGAFGHMEVGKAMEILVVGESLLNDAVTLVLYDYFISEDENNLISNTSSAVFNVCWSLLKTFTFSSILGMAFGVGMAVILFA